GMSVSTVAAAGVKRATPRPSTLSACRPRRPAISKRAAGSPVAPLATTISWAQGGLCLAWSNIRGTFQCARAIPGATAPFSLSSQLNWLDTTRVRVGWAWDHALFFGTAGAAVGGVTATAAASAAAGGLAAAVSAADTQTRFGWTAGGGVEYAFNNYISA